MTTDFALAREEEFLRQCRARRPRPPTLIDHALRGCIVLVIALVGLRVLGAATAPIMTIIDGPAPQAHHYRS